MASMGVRASCLWNGQSGVCTRSLFRVLVHSSLLVSVQMLLLRKGRLKNLCLTLKEIDIYILVCLDSELSSGVPLVIVDSSWVLLVRSNDSRFGFLLACHDLEFISAPISNRFFFVMSF